MADADDPSPAPEEPAISPAAESPTPPPPEPGTDPAHDPPAAPAPPPAARRRFDPASGAGEHPRAAVWRRHWGGVAGVLVAALCLHALIGGPWPVWRWTSSADRSPVLGPVAVVIDPGHGGVDSGAVSQGVVEKDLNLDVGRRVAQNLTSRGIEVRLTRENDHAVSLEERVRTGNSQPGAIFVSIHFNDASGDGRLAMNRASGIETFYSANKAMSASAGGWMWASLFGAGSKADPVAARDVELWSEREGASLAQSIQGALVASTAATDRGTKERSLYVTRRVRGPSVLVEGGFVSHPAEARLLGDPGYRQRLADAIADGIVKYLDGASHQPMPPAVLAASVGA